MEQGLTIISAKSKLQVGLTKAQLSIQQLLDEINSLEYNDDSLESIQNAIKKGKRIRQIIEDTHRQLKAPALQECKAYDESKNEMLLSFTPLLEQAIQKHQKICSDIAQRAKEEKEREAKYQRIQQEIDNTILTYSAKIGECKTLDEVLKFERLLNLETGNAPKYGEQLAQLQERAKPIRELITAKKIILRELNPLIEKEAGLVSDEELEEIFGKKEELNDKIDEISLKLIEKASDQASQQPKLEATQIFPEVKAKRTTYKYKVTDLYLLSRKRPDLVTMIPNDEAIKKELAAKKEFMAREGWDTWEMDGITYHKEQTF